MPPRTLLTLLALAAMALPAGCLEDEGSGAPGAGGAVTAPGASTATPPATLPAPPTPSTPAAASPTPSPTPTSSPTPSPAPSPTPSPTPSPSPAAPTPEGPLETRTLVVAQYSGYAEEARLVLDEEREWAAFWERHAGPFSPPPPRPEVDFARERVVVAALGVKPDTCWHVRITDVAPSDAGGAMAVRVTTYEPPADALCGSAATQPLHAVALPRVPERVTFSEARAQGSPPG